MSFGRSGPRIASTTGTVVVRRMWTVVEPLKASVNDLRKPRPATCRTVVPVPKYESRITITAERIRIASRPPTTAPNPPSSSLVTPVIETRRSSTPLARCNPARITGKAMV